MISIITCLFGIFVGLTTSWYFQIKPINEKDNLIEEQKQENLQVCNENKELRAEIEDIKFYLSVANRKIEQKDEIVSKIDYEVSRNEYNSNEARKIKLNKIKELADDYQSIN